MSGDWLPVLVVLGIGALAGLFVAWRYARSSSTSRSADEELRLADLKGRRDELYARLRRSDNEADRRVLEDQAARVLRELDTLRDEPPESAGESGVSAPQSSSPPPATRGHPMLVGFLGGAAMIGLVAVLVFFALRDAEPDRSDGMPSATQPMGEEHPPAVLPPEVQSQIDALRRRVEDDPGDIMARKRLALGLLTAEQFFEAFEVAGEILSRRPDDPDGLYVQGMVRMTMGQDDLAMESLNRVLEQYPNHVLALAGRGMVFMRQGDREAAVLVWERALEAAGGSHADLEQLLAIARDPANMPPGGSVDVGSPPSGTGSEEPQAPSVGLADAPAGAEGIESPPRPDSFGVRIVLAAGVAVPRGATLFVFLREGEQGPPSAVRRVQDPVFPLDLSLGPDDAMLGRALPTEGIVSARLDVDGSASTRGAEDLLAEGAARVGASLQLVLGE